MAVGDFISAAITGDAKRKVEYAKDHMQNWITMATGDKAKDLASLMQRSVHPTYLKYQTGETQGSIQAYFRRKHKLDHGTWYVRPGVGVPGNLNYLGQWTGTGKDFWHGTFNQWVAFVDLAEYIGQRIEEHWNGLK